MSSPKTSSPSKPSRSLLQWIIAGVFGLLTVAFFFRMLQAGYKWVSGAHSTDVNYKVETIFLVIYTLVCAGIAALAWCMGDDDEAPAE